MPYIKQTFRLSIDHWILNLVDTLHNEGELNYAITTLLLAYMKRNGSDNYATRNTIMGVLECAKQEFYRRDVSIFENKKIEENGDVY